MTNQYKKCFNSKLEYILVNDAGKEVYEYPGTASLAERKLYVSML
jgi:hypothetical protein